jgi:hypothetical protein
MSIEGARKRRPRGYVGKGHETIGSDILAVTQILKLPDQVLGADIVQKLASVAMDGWYPIDWLLDVMEKVDKELGPYALLQMGRRLFAMSHEARLVQVARSAADVVYGIDGMYHHANRGAGIGGWKVVRFDPGYAELEKTTPHHCVMEQGILSGALAAVKCPGIVTQKQCFRQGADSCRFAITSSFTDERWYGGRQRPAAANGTPRDPGHDSTSRLAKGETNDSASRLARGAPADSASRLPRSGASDSASRLSRLSSGAMKNADPIDIDPPPSRRPKP